MSLTDILKTIKSEAETEAQKIKEEAEIEIDELKKQLANKIAQEQTKLLANFRVAMEKKVKQAKFAKESALKTLILKKKREILNRVYDKVIEKIIGDDKVYASVIKKATEQLPKVDNAEIVLASGNPERTKKALGALRLKCKISDDTVETKGGFVLRSETLEIDNTIGALVEQIRDETEIEVSQILFGEGENN